MIRFLDIIFSLIGLILLAPFLLIISIAIKINSQGSIFYKQKRVGKNNIDFYLFKFRSMYIDADKKGLLTVGGKDSRITKVGYYLRKFKLDELPQLLNVLKGEMSIVGPRPEVRKYVDLYTTEQMKVLTVSPGITDYASIEFRNENELLATVEDAESYYITHIIPKKIQLNLKYINDKTIVSYFKIIFLTATNILKK
jgi:lipopolysaccharide/colanic/teichoic acid biosynthesis glycosyltransferase